MGLSVPKDPVGFFFAFKLLIGPRRVYDNFGEWYHHPSKINSLEPHPFFSLTNLNL